MLDNNIAVWPEQGLDLFVQLHATTIRYFESKYAYTAHNSCLRQLPGILDDNSEK